MLAKLAADAVLMAHLLFILFVALGGLLVLWRIQWALLHLPALAWGVWIELTHGICPLTPLENMLRRVAGEAGYPGGFIERYVLPLIYPRTLTQDHQTVIAVSLVAVNALLYVGAVYRYCSRRSTKA